MSPTMPTIPETAAWPADTLTLGVPAHPDFVASIRSVVRSAAVTVDLAFEDVEELQIAVNEAAALLLPLADRKRGSLLHAKLQVAPGLLCVRLWVAGRLGASIDRTSLAWMMLTALDPELMVVEEDGQPTIEISRVRSATPRA